MGWSFSWFETAFPPYFQLARSVSRERENFRSNHERKEDGKEDGKDCLHGGTNNNEREVLWERGWESVKYCSPLDEAEKNNSSSIQVSLQALRYFGGRYLSPENEGCDRVIKSLRSVDISLGGSRDEKDARNDYIRHSSVCESRWIRIHSIVH